MKILELYSTSHQFGDVARSLGHDVKSCKIDFDNTAVLVGNFDLIWYMPACSYFSIASVGKHWNKDNTPKTEETKVAYDHLLFMSKYLTHIASLLFPPRIYIENPVGKMRKLPVFEDFIRHTITQCQYGSDRMKPTDIWTNNQDRHPKSKCKNGDSCHTSAPRGSRKGTQGRKTKLEKAQFPIDLIKEILEASI